MMEDGFREVLLLTANCSLVFWFFGTMIADDFFYLARGCWLGDEGIMELGLGIISEVSGLTLTTVTIDIGVGFGPWDYGGILGWIFALVIHGYGVALGWIEL